MTEASRRKGHGTRASYNRGCRCRPCAMAKARYAKRREFLIASGRPHTDTVAVAELRPMLLAWQAAGVGIPQIASEAGVGRNTVRRIVTGEGRYVTAAVAAKLRAASPRPAGGAYVDATGTRRRLQALARIGWTYRQLGEQGGWHKNSVCALMRRETQVEQQVADRVAALYRELHLTWPVDARAARARERAKQRGWVSPLAWSGRDIDDPNARPDTGNGEKRDRGPDAAEVSELVAGRLRATRASKASRQEAFARLFNAALSIDEVADRMQVSTRTAERAKARHAAAEVSEDVA